MFLIDNFPCVHYKNFEGPWISIMPSLHKVLAHSWELIELNDGMGLGNLDEAGLEGCNKILRKIRIQLSRKNSQNSNLIDTLNRMWVASDPQVNTEQLKAKPTCKNCNIRGHSRRYCKANLIGTLSEDDQLFDML